MHTTERKFCIYLNYWLHLVHYTLKLNYSAHVPCRSPVPNLIKMIWVMSEMKSVRNIRQQFWKYRKDTTHFVPTNSAQRTHELKEGILEAPI
jgi:hypothetical protein